MENKLPDKYRNGFFKNLLLKMKYLFLRKNDDTSVEKNKYIFSQSKNMNEEKINKKKDYFEEIKHQSEKNKMKEDILAIINKKPEMINSLNVLQLYELRNMYKEIIEKNDNKISRLKRSIN